MRLPLVVTALVACALPVLSAQASTVSSESVSVLSLTTVGSYRFEHVLQPGQINYVPVLLMPVACRRTAQGVSVCSGRRSSTAYVVRVHDRGRSSLAHVVVRLSVGGAPLVRTIALIGPGKTASATFSGLQPGGTAGISIRGGTADISVRVGDGDARVFPVTYEQPR